VNYLCLQLWGLSNELFTININSESAVWKVSMKSTYSKLNGNKMHHYSQISCIKWKCLQGLWVNYKVLSKISCIKSQIGCIIPGVLHGQNNSLQETWNVNKDTKYCLLRWFPCPSLVAYLHHCVPFLVMQREKKNIVFIFPPRDVKRGL